jgi:hypothetical protein
VLGPVNANAQYCGIAGGLVLMGRSTRRHLSMRVGKVSRYGVAALLVTGLAAAQGAREVAQRANLIGAWTHMNYTCKGVPDANLKEYGVDDGDYVQTHPETLSRVHERTEFCQQRRPAIDAANKAAAEKQQAQAGSETEALLAQYKQRRDPSDVVEQILNYGATGNENGLDHGSSGSWWPHWTFLVKERKCVYKFVNFYKEADLGSKDEASHPLEEADEGIVDLNKYDSRLFDFKAVRQYDTGFGWVTHYRVLNDGKLVSDTINGVSLDRLRHGWAMIYSKYCTGLSKAF